MEVILIHKPRGITPPESRVATIEMLKKALAKPEDFVPGGKTIVAYAARAKVMTVCIWDVPNVEALMPFLEQISMAGWDTEVIPAEKTSVYIEKAEKALKATKK